jgi:hypothetical protein
LFTQPKAVQDRFDSRGAALWQAEIRHLSQTTISSAVLDDRDTVVNSDSPPVFSGISIALQLKVLAISVPAADQSPLLVHAST